MAEVIREVFSDGPEPVIALGHRLSGRLNFPRRIATAYWNAAVWTLHNRFADAVEASLKDMGIDAPAYLLKADGGASRFRCPASGLWKPCFPAPPPASWA